MEKERLKIVLSDIKSRVNEGGGLADAMQIHEKIFGKLYVNMVRAGEHSGALDAVAHSSGRVHRRSGPAEAEGHRHDDLPDGHVEVFGGGIIVAAARGRRAEGDEDLSGHEDNFAVDDATFDRELRRPAGLLVHHLPGHRRGDHPVSAVEQQREGQAEVGPDLAENADRGLSGENVGISVARFTRTLATLLKSGVPLLTSMDIVRNVVTNTVLADVINNARDSIREGESIAMPLKRSGEFPPLVYHMVAIGERSGQPGDMLVQRRRQLRVAGERQNRMQLTSLLEPIMIVIMACGRRLRGLSLF